ncbi:hypothetical protein [Pseudoxanthomonas sp. PXM02]|uniref:hypothetical protein n=1 Tax=Pseudoxanthomonas sp. PXM02 TaxID=2769294 RepID=UPI0017863116|nr:hypothetical protein [Pseudoxanthomonas sp. PXM02]MBD9477979.1 hypothetical protein [Pseudoxanthomonas sp. PXM02]
MESGINDGFPPTVEGTALHGAGTSAHCDAPPDGTTTLAGYSDATRQDARDAMDAPPNEIRLALNLTLGERIRANLLLMLRHWPSVIGTLVFIAMGVTVIVLYLASGKPLRPMTVAIALFAFCFTPIMAVLNALTVHFNKRAREPFTYTFNTEGIHVDAVTQAYTHRWAAISRVKTLGGFLMFFFAPGAAHCLSLKRLDAAQRSALVLMAREHGVAVDVAP